MPLNNEQRMWLEQLQRINPGWQLALSSSYTPGAGLLAGDVYLYVIDCSTGWLSGCTTTQAQFREIHARVGCNEQLARDSTQGCALAILAAGAANEPDGDSDAVVLARYLAVCALAQTKTWDLAAQRGNLAGHWLYLAYRKRDGGALGRPAFLQAAKPGFISPNVLWGFVSQIVVADTRRAGSVRQMLDAGGGAVLCDQLQPA